MLQFIYHLSELIIDEELSRQVKLPRYCEPFHLSQAILDHRIFPALQNYEKLLKEAARIICDTIYWITQTYFFLQERLLWMKAFSAIFGRSEAARLYTVSSIG